MLLSDLPDEMIQLIDSFSLFRARYHLSLTSKTYREILQKVMNRMHAHLYFRDYHGVKKIILIVYTDENTGNIVRSAPIGSSRKYTYIHGQISVFTYYDYFGYYEFNVITTEGDIYHNDHRYWRIVPNKSHSLYNYHTTDLTVHGKISRRNTHMYYDKHLELLFIESKHRYFVPDVISVTSNKTGVTYTMKNGETGTIYTNVDLGQLNNRSNSFYYLDVDTGYLFSNDYSWVSCLPCVSKHTH